MSPNGPARTAAGCPPSQRSLHRWYQAPHARHDRGRGDCTFERQDTSRSRVAVSEANAARRMRVRPTHNGQASDSLTARGLRAQMGWLYSLLQKFHDAFIAPGPLPLPLIRRAMLGESGGFLLRNLRAEFIANPKSPSRFPDVALAVLPFSSSPSTLRRRSDQPRSLRWQLLTRPDWFLRDFQADRRRRHGRGVS